jgi:predicted patatin/cPLA2 family phospholipase
MIEAMEERGEIIVIRPQRPIEVDRMERDSKKLITLYEEGYELGLKELRI